MNLAQVQSQSLPNKGLDMESNSLSQYQSYQEFQVQENSNPQSVTTKVEYNQGN